MRPDHVPTPRETPPVGRSSDSACWWTSGVSRMVCSEAGRCASEGAATVNGSAGLEMAAGSGRAVEEAYRGGNVSDGRHPGGVMVEARSPRAQQGDLREEPLQI